MPFLFASAAPFRPSIRLNVIPVADATPVESSYVNVPVKLPVLSNVMVAALAGAAALFAAGSYQPLQVEGEKKDNVFAFVRAHEGRSARCAPLRLPAPVLHRVRDRTGRPSPSAPPAMS